MACALGVSTTTLVHHFGTKEQLLQAILGRLRERIFAAARDRAAEVTEDGAAAPSDLAPRVRAVWALTSDPRRAAEFRLLFAVYGRALQAPEQFPDFLEHVVADWLSALCEAQAPYTDPATAARTATLVIATLRGLLLALLATGDRDRIQDAAEHFIAGLARAGGEDV